MPSILCQWIPPDKPSAKHSWCKLTESAPAPMSIKADPLGSAFSALCAGFDNLRLHNIFIFCYMEFNRKVFEPESRNIGWA